MLISIITVCYNSEKTIRDTIESVLNQTYDEVEYWIIDGASKDKTVEIANEYKERFSQRGFSYRILSEPDNGIYDAMNKGIRNATGEIIGIINSDDWYEKDALETVATEYQREPFDLFYADIKLIKQNGTEIIKHSKYDRFPTSRHWNHPTTFVTKKTYNEIGMFACKGLYDDFDFLLRARSRGKQIKIVNKVLANFRVGGVSNQRSVKKALLRTKDRFRCYRNNRYGYFYLVECFLIEMLKMVIS